MVACLGGREGEKEVKDQVGREMEKEGGERGGM